MRISCDNPSNRTAATTEPVAIRPLSLPDLPQVAEVHRAAFARSALAKLGTEAARRYYHWQFTGPHEVTARGAFLDDVMIGYCIAGVFQGALSGFLRKDRVFLMRTLLVRPWLWVSPGVLGALGSAAVALCRNAAGKSAAAAQHTSQANNGQARAFRVLALAVHPVHQGTGTGKMLMDSVEAEARSAGYREMHLRVRPENHQAVRFYERLQWQRVPLTGPWSGYMRKPLMLSGEAQPCDTP